MENRYRIVISGNNVFREIEVAPQKTSVSFGTDHDCDIRVRKDLFQDGIKLIFSKDETGEWNIMCYGNLYISVDDVRKLMKYTLQHGDEIIIRHQEFGTEMFRITFLIDFEYEKKNYNRRYNIESVNGINIGAGPDNSIMIRGKYINGDKVVLQRRGRALELNVVSTKYGVFRNGYIVNGSAIINEGDFFSIADISFCYRGNWLYTQNSGDIHSNNITFTDATDRGEYPKFRRNSRVKLVEDDTEIEILDPPEKPQKPKNKLFPQLLRSILMIVASLVMGLFGGFFIIFSLVSAGMGIVTAIMGVRDAKKEYKNDVNERINKYNTYINNKKTELNKARMQELELLNKKYISEEQEIARMKGFSYELFDRRTGDDDFLEVRLGYGNVEAKRAISYKKQERLEIEDELQSQPRLLSEAYKYIANAPIVCNFKEANAVGIVGDDDARFNILKNIIVDVCARQYHSDVNLFFVADESHANDVYQFRMLPHVYNDILGVYNIVCNDNSKTVIFEYLYKELCRREKSKDITPHLLVFLYDEYGFKSHPVSRFIDDAKELGVTFVYFGKSRADIGLGCGYIIESTGANQARVTDTEDSKNSSDFTYNAITDGQIKMMVQFLAPVYTEEISLEGSLTKNLSLFDMLNIMVVDDIDLLQRWNSSKVYQSMAAPIGVTKSGIIQLDLHDKAHGPHGLVAGTTGAGKSELLQTYVLSMAAKYHPYEVGFVIIDFKGGGMANQFRDLPHMMGTITNIDGKEIDRSLKSIKAELKKRQRLFAEADVNHIDKYIMKYRSGEVSIPLPHLILIVDEFAELKADQPEFMKELISAARIGRSLGVHLILATQKPSGQVDDQIWSNSRFKLCLKVQSQQDSNEVIKSPLAAEIKEPGRAYLQVGNNEIFELFQSAYSGAPEHADESVKREFTIFEVTAQGKRVPVYQQKKAKNNEHDNTQLDAMVEYIGAVCKKMGVAKLPNICLPSLGELILYPSAQNRLTQDYQVIADLGVYDDPDNQYQGQYSVNISEQNMMIIGSARSGKTNLLQTIIRSLTTKYSPDEVNIYIIDFASMVLKNFEDLKHVGGVVTASDDEKLKNLFKLINTYVKERKEKLLSVGVSSYAAYREAGKTDMPQIVLIIDNLTALREMYFEDDDELLNLCREGITVGISVIIANTHTSGIGYKYLSNFGCRIAMYNNDSAEYSSLFDHCSERLDDIAGRSLISLDNIHLECQTYLAFEGEKEIERVTNIKTYINKVNELYSDSEVIKIPMVPDILQWSAYRHQYEKYMGEYKLVAGLNYSTVSPYILNLSKMGALAISGRNSMGKHNFIRYIVKMIEDYYADNAKIYLVDSINRKLADLKENPVITQYEVLADKGTEIVKDIASILRGRYEAVSSGDEEVLSREPLIVLILNNTDAVEAISKDMSAMDAYSDITGKFKNMNICVIVGDFENSRVSYTSPEVLKNLRDAKHFMFFDDLNSMKIVDDLPIAVLRENRKPLQVGEAFYIRENEVVKLKTIKV